MVGDWNRSSWKTRFHLSIWSIPCMMTSSNENIFRVTCFCAGNSPVPGEFSAQRPVTRSFDVFFDLHLDKQLSKQCPGWWFETPSGSLWRQCNGLLAWWLEDRRRQHSWYWHSSPEFSAFVTRTIKCFYLLTFKITWQSITRTELYDLNSSNAIKCDPLRHNECNSPFKMPGYKTTDNASHRYDAATLPLKLW